MAEVIVYSIGPVTASACAPKSLLPVEVEAAVNALEPTGIESMWMIAADENFRNGQSNPCQCEQADERQHWLLHC